VANKQFLNALQAPDGSDYMTLTDGSNTLVNVSPFGEISVTPTPTNLFHDTFDVSLDTTNLWNTPVFSGTGATAAVVSPGQMTLLGGTVASTYSYISSKPTFPVAEPGFVEVGMAVKITLPIATNTYMAWGLMTPQSVPTAANPISEGIVFEIQPGGKMYAATYAGSTRTQIADLSSTGLNKQPTDGVTHTYYIFQRGDELAWAIDGVASNNFVNVQMNGANGPNVNTQAVSYMVVTGLSAPSAATNFFTAACWVSLTAQSNYITDGVYPFRRVTVKPAGSSPGITDLPVVVAQAPIVNVGGNATGTTGAVVGTLAAVAAKTTFINGFAVSGTGTTATVITVAGLAGGSQVYQLTLPGTLNINFVPAIGGSAVNTAITVTAAANASATAVDVNSWGYQQ